MNPARPDELWESFLTDHPQAHLLQTAAWGDLKAKYGWSAERIQSGSCGAQVLFRRLPLGLTLAYVPKGPVGMWLPDIIPSLDSLCHHHQAFALKIEPDARWTPDLAERLRDHGFAPSSHSIQPRRTLVVDLRGTEEQILARMHQKTRYNIRLASRKGVSVRAWRDLETFGEMMQETAVRDAFGAHVPDYYREAYQQFHPHGACELFVAEYNDVPLAAIMVFVRGSRAWYFYGASRSVERNRMPTYLLQWEAMLWARSKGSTAYDLWGVPDAEQDALEDQFPTRRDGLWGVYRFKRGFGGELVTSMGAWDRPYKRLHYHLYRLVSARMAGG